MRIKPIVAAAVGVAAAATGAVAVTSGAQQPSPPAGTVQLVQRNEEAKFHLVDEAPRQTRRQAFSPGDTLVTRGPLRSTAGERVGRAQMLFVVTRASGQAADTQVSGTLILRDGHIVIEGADTAKEDVDTFAIIGGSGRYAGARGTVQLTTSDEASSLSISFIS